MDEDMGWNNSNPVLICKYYLDMIEANRCKYKTIPSCLQTQELFRRPLITQSDVRNENGNVARAQTFLRQWADPELCNTVQHRWMVEKMNIPSKIVWSVLHATFSFSYEGLLQHGVDQGWYDPKVPLEV